MIRHQSQSGPSLFSSPLSRRGAPLSLPNVLKSLRRLGAGGLAIIREFFSQFVPYRMTRDEMLELAEQLRKSAERMR